MVFSELIGSILFKFSKQLLDPEEVDVVHPLDKERGMTLEDFKLIKLHMANCNLLFIYLVFLGFCLKIFPFN